MARQKWSGKGWTASYALRGAAMSLAGVLGLFSLMLSYSLRDGTSELRALADEIASLPSAMAGARGQRIVVDGRIASDAPQLRENFVIYRRTEYRCPSPGVPRCSADDVEIGVGKQPFTVQTATGPVEIVNGDYRL